MNRNLVCARLFTLVLFFPSLVSAQQRQYRVRPLSPPPMKRSNAALVKEKLPANAKGEMPTYDGEAFHLSVEVRDRSFSEDDIKSLAQQTLQALAPSIDSASLQYRRIGAETTARPAPSAEIDRRLADDKKRLSGQVGPLGKNAEKSIQDSTDKIRQQISAGQDIYIFDQQVQGVAIDNSGLRITQPKPGYINITGRVFNSVHVANTHTLTSERALAAARAYASKTTKLREGDNPQPQLILLPYGSDLRFAWKMDIGAHEGTYRFWVDAANGQVLQVEPQFFFDTGTGLVFNPAPPATDTKSFDVDPPPPTNLYSLKLAGRLDVNNSGADGVTTGDLTIASGAGSANFNVAPLNGTVVQRTSQMGYNSRFQEINTYGWVFYNMNWMESLGSRKFAAITATVNFDDPCGFGASNACADPVANTLQFGIGAATTSASTACHDVFNSAIDATVISHEFGHILSGRQVALGGGALTSSINEGLSDYWSATIHNTDTFGAFWGGNCASPGQDGFAPRQAEANDVFPNHRKLGAGGNAEAHADGQMIAWALWSTRTRLNRSALGTLAIDTNLLKALTTAGAGLAACGTCTDAEVHTSYIDLFKQLAPQFNGEANELKVFAGFADAGLFLSDQDAIIDVDRDILARGAGAPVFTVWGGRNYTISGVTGVATNSAVFNPRFQVEVANDAAFTQNLTSSGFLTSIAANGFGVGTSSWTLPAAAWDTLKGGSELCFRLTTTDANGGTQRVSTSPGNGAFTAAVPCVTINDSGQCQCSCNNQTSASPDRTVWALFLPPLGLVVLRRRLRRKERAS